MPNIAEMRDIIKYTPINQAMLWVGIHGIGKSEVIKDIFQEQGYAVITLFLGQMADAGDILGLPDRTEIEFEYNGQSVRQKITEFCPPKWWPRSSDTKLIIFMDEFNRGKPEIYQCVFDMVLNRKLNGLDLPKYTRIIAAMNPIGDEYDYDVTDLDPALIDRFNVYEFKPDHNEWLDWAIKNKCHKYVIGFISKHFAQLDPPVASVRKTGEVYPSRRSWKRVSDIMNEHNELMQGDMILFKTMIMGIVGKGAMGMFAHYIKENSKNISAGKIVTGWDNTVAVQVKTLSNQEMVHTNTEIAIYLETNEAVLFDAGGKEASLYAMNVEKYLKCLPKEIAANFFDHVTNAENKGNKWADKLLSANQKLVDWFVDVLHGQTEADKQLKENLNPDNGEGPDWDNLGTEIDDLLK